MALTKKQHAAATKALKKHGALNAGQASRAKEMSNAIFNTPKDAVRGLVESMGLTPDLDSVKDGAKHSTGPSLTMQATTPVGVTVTVNFIVMSGLFGDYRAFNIDEKP